MSSGDRNELIRNAVAFLNDPSSQASPLAQRIQFLEAKGLTPAEIDLAIRQASQGPSNATAYGPAPYALLPPPPYRWDWRDYFITAVVSGAVTYGAVALFKKYLLPHLQPPTSTAYEEDRNALTAQFDAAEALLKEIQAESAAVRAAVDAQKEQIDQTTLHVEAMVREVHDGEAKTRDEMREIRDEINSIREMLPKMIERNKESQTQSMAELQHELKSLKTLLLSRAPTLPSSSSLPSTPLPAIGRPSIPSWQLASAPPVAAESTPGLAAPHARQSSSDSTTPDARPGSPARSRSIDGHASTGHLAESALSNLRKSLSQRPASPGAGTKSPPPARAHKSTLEDRLRATFTIGDTSNDSTPAISTRVSPTPATPPVEAEKPVAAPPDPLTIPLPESPPPSPLLSPAPLLPASPKPQSPQFTDQVSVLEAEAQIETTKHEKPPPTDVDALQERLKLVEKRFSDVSTSFKRLQAEKASADAVLRELTPLETISDSQSLRDFVQNVLLKSEMSLEEIAPQEDRIGELRDTHRLESSSQSAQIEKLKKQLGESETLLAASQSSKAEIDRLKGEVERSKQVAKEEEEKRVKAISLLKTVRQKLVKAEKERDDLQRDAGAAKDKEKAERDSDQLEKARLRAEIETVNTEREKVVAALKAHDKEAAALRGQFELETLTAKSTHSKEVATFNSRISSLESTLTSLTNDKNAFFDQLQMRQAELESYQLRESEERFALLNEDITEARREQDNRSRESGSSAEDVARLLSAAEAKAEVKLGDLRKQISVMEKERSDSEAQWSRKLREKVRENDELQQLVGSVTKTREMDEGLVDKLKEQIKVLEDEARLRQVEVADLKAQSAMLQDAESSTKVQETETAAKIHALEQMVEEAKSREAQLRTSNKTLREELRKVQSSAALLERQRNPGVGYWKEPVAPEARSVSSASSDSRVASPAPTSPKNEEEVNLEYLRNVILQFLEHKEMRPNLVKVLSIILHFTPQETRRLIAKV
ncbi:hypothetical protein FB45DRAFT_990856 [Roridomyces roridus]|uniref:Peroxisomal membrane protein PEX14 n=1 Tax=Roridomyces roridus TaxID=1738132 RepID=A0AAD7BUH6_9AGAR|nr:hypothetical protein FB45DRAFT_990856 [Roridomyces roridus]